MTDSMNITRIIQETQPDEIYNLAAMSHVKVSFDTPEYTANADGIGTLRILEAVRLLGLEKKTKIYQASTSELFGGLPETAPQSEKTMFYPKSPYGAAKLFAYWVTVNYREAYNMYACNGILFNHESPRRGETFVTKKITKAVARISKGRQEILALGNLDAKRDWGYAKDYVECMWLMLQQKQPDDYVIATGETYTVRQFTEWAFEEVGIKLYWCGTGVNEKGIDIRTKKVHVVVDPDYFRLAEVELLQGDASKARDQLGWAPKTNIRELISIMVNYDLNFDSYGGV
jgi:GDPmannose 4,6-dehydratase